MLILILVSIGAFMKPIYQHIILLSVLLCSHQLVVPGKKSNNNNKSNNNMVAPLSSNESVLPPISPRELLGINSPTNTPATQDLITHNSDTNLAGNSLLNNQHKTHPEQRRESLSSHTSSETHRSKPNPPSLSSSFGRPTEHNELPPTTSMWETVTNVAGTVSATTTTVINWTTKKISFTHGTSDYWLSDMIKNNNFTYDTKDTEQVLQANRYLNRALGDAIKGITAKTAIQDRFTHLDILLRYHQEHSHLEINKDLIEKIEMIYKQQKDLEIQTAALKIIEIQAAIKRFKTGQEIARSLGAPNTDYDSDGQEYDELDEIYRRIKEKITTQPKEQLPQRRDSTQDDWEKDL